MWIIYYLTIAAMIYSYIDTAVSSVTILYLTDKV